MGAALETSKLFRISALGCWDDSKNVIDPKT